MICFDRFTRNLTWRSCPFNPNVSEALAHSFLFVFPSRPALNKMRKDFEKGLRKERDSLKQRLIQEVLVVLFASNWSVISLCCCAVQVEHQKRIIAHIEIAEVRNGLATPLFIKRE